MNAIEHIESHAYETGYLDVDNHAMGDSPEVMTAIYQEQINLVVMQRSLPTDITGYCQALVECQPHFNLRSVIHHQSPTESLISLLPDLPGQAAFVEDLALLLDMYSCLFELDEVGLRLQVLDRAMCPRFHVDKLGCRLVSTYRGPSTEWLRNGDLDRTKLGAGNRGLSDDASGLYSHAASIQQLNAGDIVLLKGEGWYGNEGLGAVHRSPAVAPHEKRVVVTMDFA
ncbi:DUF1826 domain-containing protein [Amphritea sp. 1_MG-2023]|uniref:DUF1826 domain-containing protein n=1 Tax=Amphritea sp. 1_MG-2023 TaxID=3062670 RepID=UPI0026E1B2C6|nr:DUF1826 domain-containing protein [Amphritea sp. 1_MG-2023]MDO6563769.1 DUF1826 domain-containing protein [Amphritea sp. 1_MG-2023]